MDLRIVNTCNNNCLYCLEQSLRAKKKFIPKEEIFQLLSEEKDKKVLSFYGGNPLLHPDLKEIIIQAKAIGYNSISLLTNTHGLSQEYAEELKRVGLTGINFYFNTSDREVHDRVVQHGISLINLFKNIQTITGLGFYSKAVIHVNKQNIDTVLQDILILLKKFRVKDYELINYLPVSRAKKEYSDLLTYAGIDEFKKKIENFSQKIGIDVKFIRF